jgi:hypothetical protein
VLNGCERSSEVEAAHAKEARLLQTDLIFIHNAEHLHRCGMSPFGQQFKSDPKVLAHPNLFRDGADLCVRCI